MSKNQESGDAGELDIIKKVSCPNCGKKLMILPKNYPLYDVQCIGCSFRAQVKTNNSKPRNQIFGAGWDIMEKVLKSGFITPPLITNFIWKDKVGKHQEIRFYPFIPKKNLKMHKLSPTTRRANYYKMFNYVGIDEIPYFKVYKK
jgi:ssDNA-binding Zn-finger/Zn-ribbon topoisomerase 1